MIDTSKLKEVLAEYKQVFLEQQWPNERYKWEAVKCFQDNWDINAPDFLEMLKRSFAKTENLLSSNMYYPRLMLTRYAEASPEEVRSLFFGLYNESEDLITRIDDFKRSASIIHNKCAPIIRKKYGKDAKHHYQNENAITIYLWLRYPDKYYVFKFLEVNEVSNVLNSGYSFKKGAYSDNLRNFLKLYDEIRSVLKEDDDLVSLLRSVVSGECYPDPELNTLTIDVGFYISRHYGKNSDTVSDKTWYGYELETGLSEEDWQALLKDETIFKESSLEIMKRMLDYGGEASCKQLSVKYGETPSFYISGSVSLAKRIAKARDIDVTSSASDDQKWWPVLYIGRPTEKDEDGVFIWKLRDELKAALKKTNLDSVRLYAADDGNEVKGYWWLNANPKIWSFSSMGVGDAESYTLYNEAGNKRRIFQNFLDAKVGDVVIGYEANPVKQIVAICRITEEQNGEEIKFEKIEGLSNPVDYSTLKECPELEQMEAFKNSNGSLFKLSKGEYEFIMDIIRDSNLIEVKSSKKKYTKENFLNEVYMSEEKYDRLVALLKNKKNIILQGAPGVGKTFTARRLAYSMMGEEDSNRIKMVQFHQNYSYEDFVMGYKPSENGFKLENGVFYQFCQKAMNQKDKDFFFIIDEINRGNLSKIFGELLMLIEKDYREEELTLAYNGLKFSVPENLYIIGMMNTADRSLALIDYALRRRFSFFEMEPGFDSEGFSNYIKSLNNETMNELILKVKELNYAIADDKTLGKGFCIGHSYFCGCKNCTDAWLRSVVDYDIIPLLSEYWFDDSKTLQNWENILYGVFQ